MSKIIDTNDVMRSNMKHMRKWCNSKNVKVDEKKKKERHYLRLKKTQNSVVRKWSSAHVAM